MSVVKEVNSDTPNMPRKYAKSSSKLNKADVQLMDREELEACALQLHAHNVQLKALLQRNMAKNDQNINSQGRKEGKPFDFEKHTSRHILLKFAYLGWDHQGYAVQEDSHRTIEADLFEALLKTKLIKSRETSNYHRCGRTDKGVSAFSQVISITVRSQLPATAAAQAALSHELQYVQMLNRVLPEHIRMLAWSPVNEGYSARFDCQSRTYKYFFPLGALDVQRMRDAAELMIGHHDFRNFCKMDVGNGVVNFERNIDSISIDILGNSSEAENSLEHSGAARLQNSYSRLRQNLDAIRRMDFDDTQQSQRDVGVPVGSASGDDCETNSTLSNQNACESNNINNKVNEVNGKNDNTELISNSIEDVSKTVSYKGDKKRSSHDSESGSLLCSPVAEFGEVTAGAGYRMCVASITGNAFLWHQVRAIMSVLFLVGLGKEEASIVTELLNIQKNPRKPQYQLASEVPLCLFYTQFPDVQWQFSAAALRGVQAHFQRCWAQHSIRSTMLKYMLDEVQRECHNMNVTDVVLQQHAIVANIHSKQHQPLMQRKTCKSLENRVVHFVKRRRLAPSLLSVTNPSAVKDKDLKGQRDVDLRVLEEPRSLDAEARAPDEENAEHVSCKELTAHVNNH
ncbi:tRNA pseudouridine(38/39) synthase isoform X2 [Hyalella azteca]|uniref:tRNA pseudouridine(38/39) synthase isoform X2 n=1 Tax=Hyalella azteca TaxID=294128 RepID=A0A8B7PI69_HYAAZ|nr:tRNA pseudouridine(38/39) synthase isoform X2 [Hyalella azteca]